MPMTTTHALVPLAAALAFPKPAVRWRLVLVAMFAAALPDVDGIFKYFAHVPPSSIYSHRGAAHSLFAALAAGLIAACFHRWLKVRPATAGLAVGAAMASHGILDMMTDSGRPVAYLWPLSSVRLFADWHPIHSEAVHRAHFFTQVFVRLQSELWQLIVPMFAIALLVHGCVVLIARMNAPTASPSRASGVASPN